MYTLSGSLTASVLGRSYTVDMGVAADNADGREPPVTAAKTGSLTTRTDDDEGTLTMSASHGITTGARVDIYWDGGKRVGVTVGTVATNSVPLTASGEGDVLPAALTAVTVKVAQSETLPVTGNNVVGIVAYSEVRGTVIVADAGDATLHRIDLEAGQSYIWTSATGVTNPLAGDTVAKVFFSHEDATATRTMRYAHLHN